MLPQVDSCGGPPVWSSSEVLLIPVLSVAWTSVAVILPGGVCFASYPRLQWSSLVDLHAEGDLAQPHMQNVCSCGICTHLVVDIVLVPLPLRIGGCHHVAWDRLGKSVVDRFSINSSVRCRCYSGKRNTPSCYSTNPANVGRRSSLMNR